MYLLTCPVFLYVINIRNMLATSLALAFCCVIRLWSCHLLLCWLLSRPQPHFTSWAKLQPQPHQFLICLWTPNIPPLPWLPHFLQPWPCSTSSKGKAKREETAWSGHWKLEFIYVFTAHRLNQVLLFCFCLEFPLFIYFLVSEYLTFSPTNGCV